jgi:hypothetical protein
MKRNIGGFDRPLRIVIGLALIAWALLLAGPTWAWIGLMPLLTGLFNFCPAYSLLGMSSCKTK